ncbi:MAG TPA: FAD-dependent oxidoreductase [Galbitalea sp.]|nr:FAD-dependent oxidoreductase [Galbitalea sp.]
MATSTRPADTAHAGPVIVVGAGVIGMTCAYELARAGHSVTILADATAQASVSAVAGGLWFPYKAKSADGSTDILKRSLDRFHELSEVAGTPVEIREGTFVVRSADQDTSWADVAPWHREARPDELPSGATRGIRSALPMVDTPRYLVWLEARCREIGVKFRDEVVHDIEATIAVTRAGAVVVAAGLRSAELLGDDDSAYPIRGQVLKLRNPGLRDWLLDDENPAGMTYVLPRIDDVVCGGTSDAGEVDITWNTGVEAGILERVIAAVPALEGQEIVGRAIGLRPARPTLRVGLVDGHSVPVIACYGHGGAGITLSWGSAERVVELLGAR